MGVDITKQTLAPGQDSYANGLTGVETMDRGFTGLGNGPSLSTGALRLTFFTPPSSFVANTAVTATGGTAAAATPTLCKVGVYSVATNGDLTLVASTANTPSLWASSSTKYETALSSAYTFVGGQRYAAAVLCVTGATAPNAFGTIISNGSSAVLGLSPRLSGFLSGQSDLPASISSGSVTDSTSRVWVGFIA